MVLSRRISTPTSKREAVVGIYVRCRSASAPPVHGGGSDRLADGAETAQSGKKFIGAPDIAGDLRAQFFGTAEFLLFAKALPKSHFHSLGCGLELSVEQMRFDAQRGTVERWARADIGDRAMAAGLPFKKRARDVDAPGRKQLLFRCQ